MILWFCFPSYMRFSSAMSSYTSICRVPCTHLGPLHHCRHWEGSFWLPWGSAWTCRQVSSLGAGISSWATTWAHFPWCSVRCSWQSLCPGQVQLSSLTDLLPEHTPTPSFPAGPGCEYQLPTLWSQRLQSLAIRVEAHIWDHPGPLPAMIFSTCWARWLPPSQTLENTSRVISVPCSSAVPLGFSSACVMCTVVLLSCN